MAWDGGNFKRKDGFEEGLTDMTDAEVLHGTLYLRRRASRCLPNTVQRELCSVCRR